MANTTLKIIRPIAMFVCGSVVGFTFVQILDSACTWLGVRGEVVSVTVGYGIGAEHEHEFRAAWIQMLAVSGALIGLAEFRRQFVIAGVFFAGCVFIGCAWSTALVVDQFRMSLMPILALDVTLKVLAVWWFTRRAATPDSLS